jgi:hypothetical protein
MKQPTRSERYARALLETLARAHTVINLRIVFRAQTRSYTIFISGRPQIVLGRASLRRAFERGFEEYPHLQPLLPTPKPSGLAGVHQLCLHEFAHVLQYRAGGFKGQCRHNAVFIEHYQALMGEYLPLNFDSSQTST